MALAGSKKLSNDQIKDRAKEIQERLIGNSVPVGEFLVGDIEYHQPKGMDKPYIRISLHDVDTQKKIGFIADTRCMGMNGLYHEVDGEMKRIERNVMSNIADYNDLMVADRLSITLLTTEDDPTYARVYEEGNAVVDKDGNYEYREANAYFVTIVNAATASTPKPSTKKKK